MDFHRTTTTITSPANAPINLDAGRPDWRELGPLFGLLMVALLPVGLGGLLMWLAWPSYDGEVSGWRAVLIITGSLMAFGGLSFFWALRAAITKSIARYYQRVEEWHNAVLDRYEQDGTVTATQIDERYLHVSRPNDMLLLFMHTWLTGQTPTVRGLSEGKLMIGSGHRSFVLGQMTQDQAEQALRLFAESGIILDRGPRQSGRVALLDPKQAANKLLATMARQPNTMSVIEGE